MATNLTPGDVIFNEYASDNDGNGNDFFELLVLKDGADLRGLRVSDNELVGGVLNNNESVLVFGNDQFLSNVPKGTTIAVYTTNVGVTPDTVVNPSANDWKMILVPGTGVTVSADGLGGATNAGLATGGEALYLYLPGPDGTSAGTDNQYLDFISFEADAGDPPAGLVDLNLPSVADNAYYRGNTASDNDVAGNWTSYDAAPNASTTPGDANPSQDLSSLRTLGATPGITLAQTGGNTSVTEGGTTDSYTVVLNTQPTTDVTVTLANPGIPTQLAVTPTTLTFTSANWNTPQGVTVTAVDDSLLEGIHSSTITTTIASSDPTYNGITVAPLTVSIVDNDFSISKIHDIQGSGSVFNPAFGGAQTIEGVVVAAFQGSTKLNGFYVQEEDTDADADLSTSEGIFVFDPTGLFSGSVGSKVRVTGNVGEFATTSTSIAGTANSSLTQLSGLSSVVNLGTTTLPTATNILLPVSDASVLERYEGMLVNVGSATGPLTVTETFKLGRFGQVGLSGGDRINQYTQTNAPSVSGYSNYVANLLDNYIILDDGSSSQNPDPTIHARGGQPLSATNTLRGGDTITSISGVLDERFEGYRVQTSTPANFVPTNVREATAPVVGGNLRVASANLLNFFNGNGLDANNDGLIDGGFPTARGADNAVEFKRQLDKSVQEVLGLNADVFGYNEMENDGYGSTSSVQQLVNALNAATAPGTYAFVTPPASALNASGGFGGDEITVGFIYKTSAIRIAPGTTAAALTTGVFDQVTTRVQRPSLAVTFERLANGTPTDETFTTVINHFKSKGSSAGGVGDADAGDGQGLSNGTRTLASQQLAAWLATNPTGTTDPDYLIMGDLNSYRLEDPITTLTNAGYNSLFGPESYSYQFNGQWGSLDHALSSSSLNAQVTGAAKWHINADEPIVLDYNTEFKTAGQVNSFYNVDPFRTSDHDPIVVGLNLQANNTPPVANADSSTTAEDTAITFNILTNDTDANGDTLTVASFTSPANGSLINNGNGSFTYSPTLNFNGSDSFTYTINDGKGGTASATANITVTPVNDPAIITGTTSGSVTEDSATTTATGSLTVTDVDSPTTFVTQANTSGTYGSFAIAANGTWTYTLNNNLTATNALAAGQSVTEVFTTQTADGTTQNVTLTITGSNDAPVANNDTVTTTDTQPVTIDVLANDTDSESGALAIAAFTNPASGTVVQNANNAFTFTPTLGFAGTTNFTYTIRDNGNLTATATVAVTITSASNLILGTTGNDNLVGTSRNDVIQALAGNDTLNGGLGADTLIGGAGNDTYIVDAGDVVLENLNEGTDLVRSAISWTLSDYVENLTLTGTAAINGTGNALDNSLVGNSGNNSLSGGAGNDTLNGGLGADTLAGGADNDTYIVDAGDTVVENANEGTDLVQSAITWTLLDNIENLTLTGNTAINGTGNGLDNAIAGNAANNILNGEAGNDSLNGGAGNDTLNGGDGNDTLNGGTGADRMEGGADNDTYLVDNLNDTVVESAESGLDLVQASVSWTLSSHTENLTLTGSAAINASGNTLDNLIMGNAGINLLNGNDGNDTLMGGNGNDTLIGGDGNDMLFGGNGNDNLTGGIGNDVFGYNAFSDRNDTITDFNGVQDKLDLSVLFDSLGYLGSAPIVDGYMRFTQSGNNTLVQIDQNGFNGGSNFSTLLTLNGVNASTLSIGSNILI